MTARLSLAAGLFLVLGVGEAMAAQAKRQEQPLLEPAAAGAGAAQPGAMFAPGGAWSRAEVAFLLGSQRVRENLGMSRNVFGTVTVDAVDVGFGEHYGARASVFVNRWVGVEGSWFRTTSEFEYEVMDAQAGTILLEETLTQTSDEWAAAMLLQWPLQAITPYTAFGFGYRSSEIGMADPFHTSSFHAGAGVKVPFGSLPLSITFDYRYVRYRELNEAIRLPEGGDSNSAASVLTVGLMLRTPNRN